MSVLQQSTASTATRTLQGLSSGRIGEREIPDGSESEKGIEDLKANFVHEELPVSPTEPPADPSVPPDGGFDAWMTVAGGWCLLFTSFGWLNSVGALQTYYEQNALTTYSSSSIAWIASTEIFAFFLGSPFFGKVFDSYGPLWLLIIGSFLHVFGLLMLSLGSKYYQFFLAQSICSAIGASAIAFTSMNAISTWFRKRRATALGLAVSGSSLGGIVFPIMLTRLIPHIGFGWAMRANALLVLVLLIVGVPVLKSRLKHKPTRFDPMEFTRPFAELPFLLLSLASFFFYFGNFVPYNYIGLQAQSRGVSPKLASYLVSMLNAGSMIGRILPTYLADIFGCFNLMIIVTLISTVIVLGLWIPGYGAAPIIIFALSYGFCSGAFVALVPALVAQISEIRQIGVRNGANYALLSIASLTGNPIGGALIGNDSGRYVYMQVFTGVTMVVGAAFFLASRTAKAGFNLNVF